MKKTLTTVFVLVCIAAMATFSIAGEVPTPTTPPDGVQIVTADKAKDLIAGGTKAFDMRKALNYGKGHLPNAVSTPYKWTKKGHPAQREGEFDMSKLPSDKNTPVLFHSDGPNGWKSYYASKAAVEAGYKNVMWMREGFAAWTEKGYPLEH
jgi:rhodanese-related sulfurtransferase